MIPFLLAENPQMNRKEAFEKSRQMMKGNKWAAFVLDLSFIGWSLLGIITFGLVNIFFAGPYQYLTQSQLYFLPERTAERGKLWILSIYCTCNNFAKRLAVF